MNADRDNTTVAVLFAGIYLTADEVECFPLAYLLCFPFSPLTVIQFPPGQLCPLLKLVPKIY